MEEIRCWGDSFDRLMKSSMGRVVFREFLKCEYSEENILFWLACEDLKKDNNPEVVEEKARLIYEDYISILSPKEVQQPALTSYYISPSSYYYYLAINCINSIITETRHIIYAGPIRLLDCCNLCV